MTRRLVIVGSGIAGLYAALLASDAATDSGRDIEVVLLSKGTLEQSNTFYAQGGVSAVLAPKDAAPGDSVAAHVADTLAAGAGLNDAEAVRVLCTEAVRDIAGLARYGVHFDVRPDGGPALGLEAAHSAPRILHAGGDATGACIARGLVAAVLERAVLERTVQGRLRVETTAFVTDLLTAPEAGPEPVALPGTLSQSGLTPPTPARVTGVAYLAGGRPQELAADAVLLATGGAGRLFARTSNPAVATADGLALAWRAGAAVRDLEFFQFHPTTLAAEEIPGGPPALLISEAVRGEGAVLLDSAGYRFMPGYHPDAELAPRDVVSRSIALHLAAAGAAPDSPVYLDARGIEAARGAGFLLRRFPTITAATRAAGYDWTTEPIPVSPAAHYWMGGVCTDLWGRTSVPGLYAAGEVARTGAQGANRLASNSLLEGLVFGRRAVEDFLHAPVPDTAWLTPACGDVHPGSLVLPVAVSPEAGAASAPGAPGASAAPFSRAALGRLMTSAAGVTRTGTELDAAAAQLAQWATDLETADLGNSVRAGRSVWLSQDAHEDRNLLLAARLLVTAARQRTQSVGAHYRADSAVMAGTAGPADTAVLAEAGYAGPAHPNRTAQPAGTAGQSGPASLTSGRRHPAAARSMQRI
ncbi:FAD-binding protein [Arthrobacter sp. NicSoilB8]|uniref:L-aspartate oxidase n=1 Tax=Arthrobacter sp. NicSoilB8 TaxID=2830998 RepID=UPI001CC7B677|nr:FAD-binding protein [Arthrobacter sp. NicSoilB8]BCW71912.1 L-aspartate oxidase [Arthrobacter sp. NicSoilB8]